MRVHVSRWRVAALDGIGQALVIGAGVIVAGKHELLELVRAAAAGGGVTDFLNCWQEKTDQDADDGNDHEQFNQSEAFRLSHSTKHGHTPFKNRKQEMMRDVP